MRLGGLLTSVSRVHVSDQGRAVRVQIGNHLRVGPHVVQLGKAQIRHAESRGGRARAGLIVSLMSESGED